MKLGIHLQYIKRAMHVVTTLPNDSESRLVAVNIRLFGIVGQRHLGATIVHAARLEALLRLALLAELAMFTVNMSLL